MADKAIAVRSTGCSTMNHHAKRILLLFALLMIVFWAGASSTVFADETVEIKDIKVELAKGQSVIPMHGVQIHDRGNYYDSLDYTVEGDVPLSGLAIWSIYNTVQPSGAHDTVADCNKLYTTTLQVLIDETVGDKHYTISPDSTLTIGDTEFTYYSADLNTDIGKWFCHYRCKTIRPRYIRVGNKIISFSNKDNVVGDYDVFGDGTVLYDITNNVLTLNNATLKFSKEIADLSVANDDLATRPSFIMAMGTNLNINLVGENKFVPAGEVVTDQDFISGIRQTDFESSNYSTVISGDGELAMTFDGGDTSAEVAFPYGFDGNQFILKDNASLSIDFRNCNYTNGIFIGHASTSGILDNAKLTITDDGHCPGDVMGIVTGGDYPFIFGGNSETIIDISGDESSLALFDNNDLEISDNAKVLLKSNGHALTCNGSLSFFNHDDTALVNMAASEEGRSAWDGESNLSYTYKYIRFPGLTHYEAVPATVEQSGTIEYYYDPWTDKYYSDIAGNTEISKDSTVIPAIKSGESVAPAGGQQIVPAVGQQIVPAEIQDLKAVKISKPKAAKKKVTVKWKKVSKKDQKKIGGIEIEVATDADFVNIVKSTTAKKSKTNKTIKGLQSKTTYWVRIRAYNNAADGKHVSAWKTKKVKIK